MLFVYIKKQHFIIIVLFGLKSSVSHDPSEIFINVENSYILFMYFICYNNRKGIVHPKIKFYHFPYPQIVKTNIPINNKQTMNK